MESIARVVASSFSLVLALSACAGGGDSVDTAASIPAAASAFAPDTSAEALWAHLESANYRAAWQTWPGKGTLYAGQEPHGMLLTTYLNAVALDALTNGAGRMPAGAIIVKENYMPDSTFAAATVMYKVAGYDPASNDWFWLKRNADGTVEAAGRVAMCSGCHLAQSANDYLYTGALAR